MGEDRKERWNECGNCYGNGCFSCGMRGKNEDPEWRAEYDDYLADQREDERMREKWEREE